MSLPILETPTYELILPSNGKKIKYRPFLVKEFKILLTAIESDAEEITRILTDLVDNCTFNKLDIDALAHFDIEFIFINLRAKSIGEITDLVYKCECEYDNKFTINLLDLKVNKKENFNNKIMITKDIGVILRYPKFNEMIDIYENLNSTNIIELICNCIEKIFTKDQVYQTKDQEKQDIITFLESFTKEQFEKIEKFFLDMPRIIHDVEHTCDGCKKVNNIKLEGLQNFFV